MIKNGGPAKKSPPKNPESSSGFRWLNAAYCRCPPAAGLGGYRALAGGLQAGNALKAGARTDGNLFGLSWSAPRLAELGHVLMLSGWVTPLRL